MIHFNAESVALRVLQGRRAVLRIDFWRGVDLETITKLCRGDDLSMKVETLCRVRGTLALAPAELVPALAAKLLRICLQADEALFPTETMKGWFILELA